MRGPERRAGTEGSNRERGPQTLDLLVGGTVKRPPSTTPPPSPGACYMIADDAGDAWAGKSQCVAAWTSGGWRFIPEFEGLRLSERSRGTLLSSATVFGKAESFDVPQCSSTTCKWSALVPRLLRRHPAERSWMPKRETHSITSLSHCVSTGRSTFEKNLAVPIASGTNGKSTAAFWQQIGGNDALARQPALS
jgi:hypothetical protein